MAARGDLIQTAERLVARGKLQAAVKEYRRVIDSDPEDTNTLNRLGDLYVRLDQVDEAVALFRRIAEHYATDGFFVKAIAIYKKILRLDPTQFDVYEILAGLYHRQGLVSEARSQYEVVADYFRKHDNLDEAIRIQRKMTELEPDRVTHKIRLAELYQEGSETASALGQYRKIADLMVGHGRIDDAVKVYVRALTIGAHDLAFVTDSILGLKEKGHPEAARRVLDAAIDRNPEASRVGRLAGLVGGHDGASARPGQEAEDVEVVSPSADVEETAAPTEAPPTEAPEESSESFFELNLDETPPNSADLAAAADELTSFSLSQVHPDLREATADVELELDLGGLEPIGEIDLDALDPEAVEELDVDELERSAAEVEAARGLQGEDLLAEAEVLVKYGLDDKGLERLAELLQQQPRHLEARALRIRVLLRRESRRQAVEEARELERLSGLLALQEPWDSLRRELVRSGVDLDAQENLAEEALAEPPTDLGAEPLEPDAEAPSLADLEVAEPAAELFEEPFGEPESPAPAPAQQADGVRPDVFVVPEADLEWLEVEPPVRPESLEDGDQLFEDEDQFFDLAAELERELDDDAELPSKIVAGELPVEQTLEQIVAGFKKGVEESLSPEDYDTHYNLGIAYREMGLLDEAIGEFQLAAKDARYLVDCCSMLGLCFLDKGFPELAIKWYRRALDAEGIGERESLGLLYELGNVYESMGDLARAREIFVEIYGINSNYRDVVARLEDLRRH